MIHNFSRFLGTSNRHTGFFFFLVEYITYDCVRTSLSINSAFALIEREIWQRLLSYFIVFIWWPSGFQLSLGLGLNLARVDLFTPAKYSNSQNNGAISSIATTHSTG